jgi:hypothetical protein
MAAWSGAFPFVEIGDAGHEIESSKIRHQIQAIQSLFVCNRVLKMSSKCCYICAYIQCLPHHTRLRFCFQSMYLCAESTFVHV